MTVAALNLTGGIPGDSEGDTLASEIQDPLQIIFLVLAAFGGAVAWRWEAAGAMVMGAAAAALGLLAAFEYPWTISVGVALVFAVPAVLVWVAWRQRWGRRVLAVAVSMGAVLLVEVATAQGLYAYYLGPQHPVSTTRALAVDRVQWMWSGGLTSRQATVVARLAEGRGRARLLLEGPDGRQFRSASVTADTDGIARLRADGLTPATPYRYTVEVDGHRDQGRGNGRLVTFPEGPASFTLAVASCARTASNGVVFDAIRRLDPLLYLMTGDFHYQNLASRDPDAFLDAYDRVLSAPAQAALYRTVPVDYVWDDHDYGPADSDASSPSRAAARRAYRQAVPHPPLPAGARGAIYHAFTIGRVRVVVTDTRSERTEETMLGSSQREWLLGELRGAGEHALMVWVNPDPWIDAERRGEDTWGGYAAERRQIADAIAGAGVRNLVMVSGDAHMVAIDDGTNSGYATGGGGGFPVLHAAALDRRGKIKGGPYSGGAHPGAGRFGLVEVNDRGSLVSVELSGRDWRGRTLVRHRFEVVVPSD
ncbi:MAG: alkaline phosphatase family protein [Actinomycetota bacterium]|nr:alkaline phosphatase family protein [Actinomycetota bacterium]